MGTLSLVGYRDDPSTVDKSTQSYSGFPPINPVFPSIMI